MFTGVIDIDRWLSGTDNRSAMIDEQLNTPTPGKTCGFEYDCFRGLGASETKFNLTNKFNSSSSSITKNSGDDYNNNHNLHTNEATHGLKEQPFELKCNDYDSSSNLPTLPFDRKLSIAPAGFNSWEFESCLEEALLSPSYGIVTPPHSMMEVASPGSSSGDTERKLDEKETCVDFNSLIFSPEATTPIVGEEEDDFNIPFHEEIEQLSKSFYCSSNNLISIKSFPNEEEKDSVSPSTLDLLPDESVISFATIESHNISEKSNFDTSGAVLGTQPSIADSFFSDADDDEQQLNALENQPGQEHIRDPAGAVPSRNVSNESDDNTVDVKMLTQLEHNYTIKVSDQGGESPIVSQQHNTVKESKLSQLLKSEETLRSQQRSTLQQQRIDKKSSSHRLRLQRKKMIENNRRRNRVVPSLKLKIINPLTISSADDTALMGASAQQMALNTPDVTNAILDLEAETMKKEEDFDLLAYITSGTDYDEIPLSPIDEKPILPLIDEQPPTPVAAVPDTSSSSTTICSTTLSDLLNSKRKLSTLTIENLDELTAATNPKRIRSSTAAASAASSVCGDNFSETSSNRPQKRRGRPPKQVGSIRSRSEYKHLNEEDMRYREQRDKNNEASRKSRINRKDRELRLESEARELCRQYDELKLEEQQVIRECARWRRAVMRLALL
ncbi:uncharacterized protein LOC129769147 [Toxorhynchites rutilus septentrionalis]|uniref:uncharacterized protein LOC129769147 n=1 Tax=Toxorhynchites rutilus septentrionalis TaxID=329112 RepID=UPI00247B2207|nr:uncharacterized protein LOC129769147 [Toxorhynchites rutilus septentrionalis]XP_055627221.1 uncharacterized protein LOC129769147 [Toxorhynchites rutilus septentrionalis]